MSALNIYVHNLYSLAQNEIAATRYAIRFTETFLEKGEFEKLDSIIKELSPSLLPGAAILAIISLTRFEKDKFVNRDNFINTARLALKVKLPENEVEELLKNRI